MNLCDLGRVIILILCINGKNNDEGIEFRRFNISKDCEYSFKCNTNSIYNGKSPAQMLENKIKLPRGTSVKLA